MMTFSPSLSYLRCQNILRFMYVCAKVIYEEEEVKKKSDFLLYQISCYDSSLILFFSMLMNWYCQCCVRAAYKLIYYFWTKKYSEKRENHFTISILYWCFFSNIMQVCMWKWSCQTHRRIWWPRKFVSLCFFFFPF